MGRRRECKALISGMKALRPVPRAVLWMSDLVTFLLGNLEERLFIKCFENFRRRAVQIAVFPRELAPKLSLLTAPGWLLEMRLGTLLPPAGHHPVLLCFPENSQGSLIWTVGSRT